MFITFVNVFVVYRLSLFSYKVVFTDPTYFCAQIRVFGKNRLTRPLSNAPLCKQPRSQDLEKGGFFERVRKVQTTLTRIFIVLESESHGLSEN